MEWMLQSGLIEVDDAVSALRLFAMGWSEEIGLRRPAALRPAPYARGTARRLLRDSG